MDYVIVQAGGKGSRLKHLTENKAKALVPIDNLPILFHLFNRFPDKKFIIIADYKKEILREYLHKFAKVKYQIVDAIGAGTCSGIRDSLKLIPENEAFMLIWCDLILNKQFKLPCEYEIENKKIPVNNYVGLSRNFSCRWRFTDGQFKEERSSSDGVAGLFLFANKAIISDIPTEGEFVRWLSTKNIIFNEAEIEGTREYGTLEEIEKLPKCKCRPFNRISIVDDILIKEAIDAQGEKLAKREVAWYKKVQQLNIPILPKIYGTNPLKMELINGLNIYECNYDFNTKKDILKSLITALNILHKSETVTADSFSINEAYYNKTMNRLEGLQDLIPFAKDKTIIINGRECRNIYFYKRLFEKKIDELKTTCNSFSLIHGDCTFSNMMVREDNTPVLLDPRGYFGFSEIYGDVRYDWAKLYYSIVGNYDQFNLKRFRLIINENQGVDLEIKSNNWQDMEDYFFELTKADKEEIKLIHAAIWLSLTTYAWEDFDSICGAFYNGLYYLEEIL